MDLTFASLFEEDFESARLGSECQILNSPSNLMQGARCGRSSTLPQGVRYRSLATIFRRIDCDNAVNALNPLNAMKNVATAVNIRVATDLNHHWQAMRRANKAVHVDWSE